jgi:hypothetical protein
VSECVVFHISLKSYICYKRTVETAEKRIIMNMLGRMKREKSPLPQRNRRRIRYTAI